MTLSSSRLGETFGGPGYIPLPTVPVGQRWLLRDARLWNGTANPVLMSLSVELVGGSYRRVLQDVANGERLITLVDAFIVMEAGERLVAYSGANFFSVLCTGHKWTL